MRKYLETALELPRGSFINRNGIVAHDEWQDHEGIWHLTHPEGQWRRWPTGSPMRQVNSVTGDVLTEPNQPRARLDAPIGGSGQAGRDGTDPDH